MTEEEVKMIDDKNYEVLAQIYTILNDGISKKSIAMEKVLQKDFDINYSVPSSKCSLPNIADHTALDFALDKRELEIFKILIKHGANFTNINQSGTTILHRAIEKSFVKNKQCYNLRGKLEHPFVQSVLSAHIETNEITNPHDQNGISHFHIACMFNHTEAVEFFLSQGVCMNQAINLDSKVLAGYTPLHLAAKYSAFETAKLLLDHNADVNLKDSQGLYPLQLLIQRNIEIFDWVNVQKKESFVKLKAELLINEKIIRLLLKENRISGEVLSRFHVACTLQDTQILELAMAEGANLNDSISGNSPIWPGYTALHFAVIFNLNAARLLLANGANILAKDADGFTPLDLCLQRYSPEAIHSIITIAPELNKITFFNTNTKLGDLILAMSEEGTLRTFLRETVQDVNMSLPVDSPVWPGYTILHVAVDLSDRIHEKKDLYEDTDYAKEVDSRDQTYFKEKEYFKRTELCLTMGADVTKADFHNSTPLHLAFRLQNRHIVKLLLKYHHKLVNVGDSGNFSHLHIACVIYRSGLVEKLLQAGVDVNLAITSTFDYRLTDYDTDDPFVLHFSPGWTCLHIAVATSNRELVDILMKYNPDWYAQDFYEMTAIHQVLHSGCRIFDNVLSPKYYEDHVTSFGLTHLHAACFVGDLKAVKALLKNGADIEAAVNYNQIRLVPALSFLASFDAYTPLHFALRGQRSKVVKLLVQHGANLFAKTANGSILFYEALKSPFKIYDYIDSDCGSEYEYFSGGEEYNRKDKNDDRDDDNVDNDYDDDDDDEYNSAFVTRLFNDIKIEKLVKEDCGITKLHIACLRVNSKMVTKLLKKGAYPSAQIPLNSPIWPGCTPLHILMNSRLFADEDSRYRLYYKIKRIGKSLLKHGASITLKDAEGNTPVHKAPKLLWSDSKITEDGLFLVGWIFENLTDFGVNPIDAGGISHFDVACMTAQEKVVERFLKGGVDVNRHFGYFTDRYGGFTALHLASFYKTDSVVDVLLKYGANPRAKDLLDNTPSHAAAVYCRLGNNGYRPYNEMIYEILNEAGADVETKNLWNETPLAVALRTDLLTSGTLYHMFTSDTLDHDFAPEIRACRTNLFSLENEEGLLGVALRFRCTYTNLEKHCVCKTVADAPELNGADEMGRTVIHNVVSVNKPLSDHWKNGFIGDYIKIIHGYVNLDFDIDHQDNTGKTALHTAVRFGNYNGIVGLLMNGADINIVDANNKTAFAYSIESKKDTEENRGNVIETFLLHVYKLQIAGLEISNANQELAARILKQVISCPKKMQCCSQELESLKKHTINSSYSVTMYNFLTETIAYFRMMLYHRDSIDNIFIKNVASLRETYPQFAGLLQMQYRNIFIRSQLIDPAKSALNVVARCAVPDLCSEEIIKRLKNKDLKQLIAAAELQNQ